MAARFGPQPTCRLAAKAQQSCRRARRPENNRQTYSREEFMRFQLMTLKLVTMLGVVLGVAAARAAPFM
ncbi:MAG: hypothetical protein WBF02_12620, partial [Xanthobacteraceae bacterium]